MSEYIQNSEYKERILKGLIQDLHRGRDFDEVKREFGELVKGVDATEIADMEQRLIGEGMPPEEIKKMCDVHAALFRESLSRNEKPELLPGHPLHTLKHENDSAKNDLSAIEDNIESLFRADDRDRLSKLAEKLRNSVNSYSRNLDRHFSKKENIFFPYLERHNITGPPSVMWSVDDEIRDMAKGLACLTGRLDPENADELLHRIKESFVKLKDKSVEMFFKEEEILSPMMLNVLTEGEWSDIKDQSDEFGVVFSPPEPGVWQPAASKGIKIRDDNTLELETGGLTPKQINAILTNLPVDITFVDENDKVAYFSLGKERIFTRTRSIIGRRVQNCHPPESVHVVEKIVNDFKSGSHSSAQFWLVLDGSFIHIRYLALRDDEGKYIGTMEVTQNLTELRALQGERRLLQYSD